MLGMAPPPAADVQQQMSPMAMSSQRPPGQGLPGQQQPPAAGQPDNGGPGGGNPIEAQVMIAVIHLKQAMEQEPQLAPYFNSAIKTIQVGLGTVLGNQQAPQGPGATQSAAPPNEPGAGLPI